MTLINNPVLRAVADEGVNWASRQRVERSVFVRVILTATLLIGVPLVAMTAMARSFLDHVRAAAYTAYFSWLMVVALWRELEGDDT